MRTVKPNGEAIKRLRLEKGWRVEDLAKRAGCSVKTVENVERGANALMFTLTKFAEAFGVEFPSLIQGAAQPAQTSKRSGKRVEIEFKVSIDYDEFDESSGLVGILQEIRRLIGARNEFDDISVRDGSVVIKLTMSEEDARRLRRAIEEGKLRDLSYEGRIIDHVHVNFGSWVGGSPADLLDDIIRDATATIWRATIGFVLLFMALIGMGTILITAISQAVAAGVWGREMMAVGAAFFALTVATMTITYLLVIRSAVRIRRAARVEEDRRSPHAPERPTVRHHEDA